jgi:hypothetical protein
MAVLYVITAASRLDAADSYPRKIPGALSWIGGRDGSILMCVGNRIARSTDEGETWQDIGTVTNATPTCCFSRLADGALLLLVSIGADGHPWENVPGATQTVAWVRSDDDGHTWSKPTPILTLRKHWQYWGPICLMQDGRWGFCPYFEEIPAKGKSVRTYSMLMWSEDQGRTWSEPIEFPKTADGNRGLTEMTVAQLGPRHYFAAIRADDTVGSWDGFYWSESTNGLQWSVPESFGERGRMPLIYQLKDGWALAYRQYDADKGVQHSAIRFSSDGRQWANPQLIETGVGAMPQLVELTGRIIVFNKGYPDGDTVTRHVIDIDTLRR